MRSQNPQPCRLDDVVPQTGGERGVALKWGLVGLGSLGQLLSPAFAAAHNGQLVACASRTYRQAEGFAREHRVARAYPSYRELVRDPEVEAVYVATPNHLHYPVVMAAAAAGKQVLCEKPMAPTTTEAEEMVDACRSAGVMLRIGFYLRFLPVVQAAASAVRDGRLGDVLELTVQRASGQGVLATWRQDLATAGAGVLADVGVHLVDIAQVVVGEPVTRAFALARPPRSSGLPDETMTALLEFPGGCQATVRCSRNLASGSNDLQVFGTRGTLASGPLRWVDDYRLTYRTREGSEEKRFPAEDLYRLEIESFAEELSGGRTVAATGEEGLQTVRVTEALIRSLETGASVEVESPRL